MSAQRLPRERAKEERPDLVTNSAFNDEMTLLKKRVSELDREDPSGFAGTCLLAMNSDFIKKLDALPPKRSFQLAGPGQRNCSVCDLLIGRGTSQALFAVGNDVFCAEHFPKPPQAGSEQA